MYSVTISDFDGSKVFTQKFETKELKEAFIHSEYMYTLKHLKALWAAFTKDERDKAKRDLYVARMNHMKQYSHEEVEKELA